MRTRFVASVLSALLYAQGLLGFSGLAIALMKHRGHVRELTMDSEAPAGPSLLVVR